MEAGGVTTDAGAPVTAATAYQPGVTVLYFREVAAEPVIPVSEGIVFQDDRILVVDKPHFLPVTPSGGVVNECLLFRLQRRTATPDLAPIHRLDRDTAGLVLFAKRKPDRAHYTQLFATGQVERTYVAVAEIVGHKALDPKQEWLVENRLESEPGSFRMRTVPGEVNARTRIALKEVRGGRGLFELRPSTGKKHQLRIHMMSLGFPIVNDPFYPELRTVIAGDYSRPMQLVASALSFHDRAEGISRHFETKVRLDGWNPPGP